MKKLAFFLVFGSVFLPIFIAGAYDDDLIIDQSPQIPRPPPGLSSEYWTEDIIKYWVPPRTGEIDFDYIKLFQLLRDYGGGHEIQPIRETMELLELMPKLSPKDRVGALALIDRRLDQMGLGKGRRGGGHYPGGIGLKFDNPAVQYFMRLVEKRYLPFEALEQMAKGAFDELGATEAYKLEARLSVVRLLERLSKRTGGIEASLEEFEKFVEKLRKTKYISPEFVQRSIGITEKKPASPKPPLLKKLLPKRGLAPGLAIPILGDIPYLLYERIMRQPLHVMTANDCDAILNDRPTASKKTKEECLEIIAELAQHYGMDPRYLPGGVWRDEFLRRMKQREYFGKMREFN